MKMTSLSFSSARSGVYEHIRHRPEPLDGGSDSSSASVEPSFASRSATDAGLRASRNVTAVVGRTARLHCVVADLGDRRVS